MGVKDNNIKTMSKDKKESIGVANEEKLMEKYNQLAQVYSMEEMKAYALIIKRLDSAKEMRNKPHKYFDGLGYVEDYITNENAKNTYLRPKLNDSEVRVNTGLLEKKIETIVNELLTMNLQPEVRTFDREDLELIELGQDFTDIVTRTNQIEKDDDFWIEAIYELLTQRAVFIRENYVTKTLKDGKSKIKIAQKELISGLKVFLGDISIPAYKFNEQPYVVTVNLMSYDRARILFGHLPNFEHVVSNNKKREEYLGGALDYRFSELSDGEVEIITYESLPDNEYQVIINGVMMYGLNTPLPQKYCDKYSIQMFILKSNSNDFAYGRPLAASAKTLQALNDETIRLLMRKFQQAVEPPIGVKKGKIYSRDIWDPSSVVQGVSSKDFEHLIKHTGVTDSELAMMKVIEQKTEEFIGANNVSQGIGDQQKKSASEVLLQQKQFVKQLGLAVYAISRMKRDMSELRIYNILENYTKPVKKKFDPLSKQIKNIYRSFTLDNGVFGNNERGRKVISMVEEDPNMEQLQGVYEEEEKLAKRGKPTRYKFLNIKLLKEIPQFWYVVVNAQDREGTALDKVLYQDQLNQGAIISKLTGQTLNPDTVTQEFERRWQARNWFQKKPPMNEETMAEDNKMEAEDILNELQGMGGNAGQQIPDGLRRSTPRPNINQVANI
jgi:hypothetical protein